MFHSDKELTIVGAPTKHYCLPKWRDIVDKAAARGRFDFREQTQAANWDTCACGEAMGRYQVQSIGNSVPKYNRPMDIRLADLGNDFYQFVRTNQFRACRLTLDAIEQRLEELDVSTR